MTLQALLSAPLNLGVDALGNTIIFDTITVNWIILDYTCNEAHFECTLPNRPDVQFAKIISFDPSDVNTSVLVSDFISVVEASVPPATVAP